MMPEPANLTAWVDRHEDTWVRLDEHPSPSNGGTWYPLTDGPSWDEWARTGVGTARPWSWMACYEPFVEADPDRTAAAIERVRQAVARCP